MRASRLAEAGPPQSPPSPSSSDNSSPSPRSSASTTVDLAAPLPRSQRQPGSVPQSAYATGNRPSLQRQSASRIQGGSHHGSGLTKSSDDDDRKGGPSSSSDETSSDELDRDITPQATTPAHASLSSTLDDPTLQRLKDEMFARLAQSQQQVRKASPAVRAMSNQTLAARRISPIKEEPSAAMSPTLNAAFASPLTTGQRTTSTESTESTESTGSSRTIRGSAAATPAASALRTPSYPFPYVPGTPRTWSSSFHKPFTTLSPTVSSMNVKASPMTESSLGSGTSTPAATTAAFLPSAGAPNLDDDPQYPSPNLYELVLALSSEPGLESWWATLSQTVMECYGVERMSLAVPADAGELENVPWGQRATFNRTGPPEPNVALQFTSGSSNSRDIRQNTSRPASDLSSRAPTLQPATLSRPRLQDRHSYAGYERDFGHPSTASQVPPTRPRAPSRTKSHAPQVRFADNEASNALPLTGVAPTSQSTAKATSFSDPDFSISGSDIPTSPFMEVLPLLRALNYESHALLDTGGVNKILARGKAVTLTRDYSSEAASRKNSVATQIFQPTLPVNPSQKQASEQATKQKPLNSLRGASIGDYFARPKTAIPYEEYEQFPSSPWAQSPAPSPAIQADMDENPFFAAGSVDEDSFNPKLTSPEVDYSKYGQVEAIGIDQASTIIHLPLIHPILSQTLPPRDRRRGGDVGTPTGEHSPRKAPIAIISLLSNTVPYPQNLLQSLKLLTPHLATSFSNAQQYSSIQTQASSTSRRLSAVPRIGSTLSDASSLGQLMDVELDNSGSISGSMTSPSDYSGRSRQSPVGSVAGTPAWDPAMIGFSGCRSVGSTPGVATEMIDSYFDAKRRTPVVTRATNTQGRESPSPVEPSSAIRRETETTEQRSIAGGETRISRREDKSTSRNRREHSPTQKRKSLTSERGERKPHTLLHSYGADFQSTFQSLPAAATLGPKGTALPPLLRTETEEYNPNMPPPSERLLRTIIDSLPVQIFTAAPITGGLTWVNTKYLVYRGQEPQQILQDPWQGVHPDDRGVYEDQWRKCLENGQQFSHKVRLRRFDNTWRWFYTRATPLRDKRQKIVHWTGTNMDIHEQHQAEMSAARQQETAASEAKYRALANSSPQIVFAVNRAKGVTFCNSQWTIYSGQTEEQARGIGFMDYVNPEDLAKCRLPIFTDDGTIAAEVPTTALPADISRTQSSRGSSDDSSDTCKTITSPGMVSPAATAIPQTQLSKLASEGILKVSRDVDGRPSYSTEVRLRSKEGAYRWHLVRVLQADAVHKDEDEEEVWYGTCTDINDHKVLEQTLKDTMDAKSRFLSNMSHEIRTPLNGITGMVNFLIDSNLTAEQMEHVNIIRSSTEGLRDLINDILDLSKVEAGMINLQQEWMHIRTLIEEVNDLTSTLAIDKGLDLNYMIDADIPTIVKGDRFRIRQVLLNVVGNAIKFTQVGEVFVRCSAAKHLPGDGGDIGPMEENETMLQFDVIDTGAGFTAEEARFLFKRFSQIDSSSTKQHSGTGLGLAISMQLVELHGGKMTATSRPGHGSCFTFTIKFVLPSAKDHPAAPAATTPGVRSRISTPAVVPARPLEVTKSTTLSPPPIQSPSFGTGKRGTDSPADSTKTQRSSDGSSASSDHSIQTALTSAGSGVSSTSSLNSELVLQGGSPMHLELPILPRDRLSDQSDDSLTPSSQISDVTIRPSSSTPLGARVKSPLMHTPSMFSILLVCPMKHAREAAAQHIEMTIPRSLPHHITAKATFDDCLPMFNESEPVIFTHVVLIIRSIEEIIAFVTKICSSLAHNRTNIVIITDLAQKREIIAHSQAKRLDLAKLQAASRIRFVFRPVKPSKFAAVFDPRREGEMAMDRSQDNAQAVAVNQKLVFEELKRRLGGRGLRVLLVEDNKTNQMVLQKFLKKVDILCDCVQDGQECTDRIFATKAVTYNIILCDLHMPNKDGYQTCKEIRRWERKNARQHLPIIALSANVLGDVYAKCVDAGFNSYVTKPVDFKELGEVLSFFLDSTAGDSIPDAGKFMLQQR